MRVSHFLIGCFVLVLIGTPVVIFAGWLVLPSFEIGGFKFGGLNKKDIEKAVDKAVDLGTGYTPAKNPTEAMDKFREAIHARKYRSAGNYTTKEYKEMLERADTAASAIGTKLDKIREFGKNQGILTDKCAIVLNRLDAFPKNFDSDKPPEMKGDKAYGNYKWLPVATKAVPPNQIFEEIKQFDADMYQTVLAPPDIFMKKPIELVKEGEEWKLNIPTNPQWETAVAYYIDHYKTLDTGLDGFIIDQTREKWDNPAAFEGGVFAKLRAAKK